MQNIFTTHRGSLLAGVFLISVAGCGEVTVDDVINPSSSVSEQSADDSALANAMVSGVGSLDLAMQPDNGSSESSAALKVRGGTPKGCSNSDPNVRITTACDDALHTSTMTRDFGAGCHIGEGIRITGKEYVGWTGMGAPACLSAGGRPDFWVAVQGTPLDRAEQVVSTDPSSPTAPSSSIFRYLGEGAFLKLTGYASIKYSGYQKSGDTRSVTGVLNTNTSLIKYHKDGERKIFDHTVTTPTPITFTLQSTPGKPMIHQISSGEVVVSHNLAKFTVRELFNNVQWDHDRCECAPVGGTVTISVTDNTTSREIGRGTVTFTAGEKDNEDECGNATVTFEGRPIKLPRFHQCH